MPLMVANVARAGRAVRAVRIVNVRQGKARMGASVPEVVVNAHLAAGAREANAKIHI